MKTCRFAAASLALLISGCEVPELESPQASAPAQPVLADSASVDEAAPAPVEPATSAGTAPAESSNPGSPNPNEPPAVTGTPREVSDLDPAKGKQSRAAGGYLGAVAGARFYAEHSLIFDQVRHALELYNAEKGEYPQSHEEFVNVIIKPNNINLPALDPGVEYIYVPEEHKLMVWRPDETRATPQPLEPE